MSPLIIIAILFAAGYVFLIRPSQRRRRQHAAMQAGIAVGDEIISAGGIHGRVKETGEDEIELEIAPGVVVTLDRRAIAAVAVAEEPEPAEEPAPEELESPKPVKETAGPDGQIEPDKS
jgi:preprotein translocase subunit YajC